MYLTHFNDSKYTKCYINLIEKAKSRTDKACKEKHHIIPRSLGGKDIKSNLSPLSYREHFIAHLLLPKMCISKCERIKMNYALWNMVNRDGGKRTNSHTYSLLRKKRIKFLSEQLKGENNPMYGKKHSEETKQKISEGGKGLKRSSKTRMKISLANKGEKNSMYGKHISEKNRRKRSLEISANNPMWSEQAKQKIRESKKETINCFDIVEHKFIRILYAEYISNKFRYKNNNSAEAKLFKSRKGSVM